MSFHNLQKMAMQFEIIRTFFFYYCYVSSLFHRVSCWTGVTKCCEEDASLLVLNLEVQMAGEPIVEPALL